jgi:ribosomal protein S27E
MTTAEKVAYLKGLADGLGLGKETKEDKLISAIIETLEVISGELDDLNEANFDLSEELDALSDDLADLEEIFYGDDEDDDFDDDFDEDDDDEQEGCGCGHHHGHGHGCGCGHHHGHGLMYEITCPACNNTITVDEEVLELGSIQCPSCGGTLEFDFEGSEEQEGENKE